MTSPREAGERERYPYDLETDNSGAETLARVMRALVETGSTMTDAMRFSTQWGRGISLFLRVHVRPSQLDAFREKLGRGVTVKDPPKIHLGVPR